MRTLDQLECRTAGRITAIDDQGPITARLLALGLLPGAVVRLVGVAPLGDPLIVEAGRQRLSLRRSEARALTIEPLD
jgi:Fe2+ transport system protein FeoA